MGKTRDLFKKTGDTEGRSYSKMGTIKDKDGMDPTEAEDIRRGCKNTQSSVQFSLSVISDSLQPHGLQHARPPCPATTPGVYSNSCPLTQ